MKKILSLALLASLALQPVIAMAHVQDIFIRQFSLPEDRALQAQPRFRFINPLDNHVVSAVMPINPQLDFWNRLNNNRGKTAIVVLGSAIVIGGSAWLAKKAVLWLRKNFKQTKLITQSHKI